METKAIKEYKEVCPYCKKEFHSTNENEAKHNYLVHLGSCKIRAEKKKAKEIKK